MPRPRSLCRVGYNFPVRFFKPQGIPTRQLPIITLLPEEVEAIRLHDRDGLTHVEAALEMGISQPTFTRILERANHKVAQFLSFGWALKLEN